MSAIATICSAEEEADRAAEADKDKAREADSEEDSQAVAASLVEEEDPEDSNFKKDVFGRIGVVGVVGVIGVIGRFGLLRLLLQP